nr:LysR family transcriptional regulator [uncultured Amphritea sp.]
MDINAIQTFLELASTGNFSRVAEHLHITQSTVSARIKVLEETVNRQLFERTSVGVHLTPAGQRFHNYAVSMQQLWQQGQKDLALPEGFDGMIGVGVHLNLWKRVFPGWINWMRMHCPSLGFNVEMNYSERLTEMVSQGLLDVALTQMPKVLPGLHIEQFMDDELIMVSHEPKTFEECNNIDYLYIDWSYGYREEHRQKLPHLHSATINIGLPEAALEYLLVNSGYAYLSLIDVQEYLDDKRLYAVEGAPDLNRPIYLIYSDKPIDKHYLDIAVKGLREMLFKA